MSAEFERVVGRLQGSYVSGNRRTFQARCPAHDDRTPSLSVSEGHGGKVLLRCHAGCPTEAVVGAMGLKMNDLFPGNGRSGHTLNGRHRGAHRQGPGVATKPKGDAYPTLKEALAALDRAMRRGKSSRRGGKWYYRDAAGKLVAVVVRYDEPTPPGEKKRKTFRPLRKHHDPPYPGD